jgi:hypothetical protein
MMKKIAIATIAMTMLAGSIPATAANPQRGGAMGFLAGCLFGVRAAGDYNDGKQIHWREWVMLVPFVNIAFAVWNGIDGAGGWTTKDFATQYGSQYY